MVRPKNGPFVSAIQREAGVDTCVDASRQREYKNGVLPDALKGNERRYHGDGDAANTANEPGFRIKRNCQTQQSKAEWKQTPPEQEVTEAKVPSLRSRWSAHDESLIHEANG